MTFASGSVPPAENAGSHRERPGMTIETAFTDFRVGGSSMRTYVARPRAYGRFPGIVAFSDIFQLTGATLRAIDRLAGHGFAVFAPEIYHRLEPAATALPFDDAGKARGQADADATLVADFDADARTLVAALRDDERVDPERLGAVGWCLGGHLAVRAALRADVRATVAFYPTGLADGKLGTEAADTLARCGEIGGDLLLIFGERDPHVPAASRGVIADALTAAGVRHTISLYDAEHAFMRDEGPRYDPALTDRAYAEAVAFFTRVWRLT
jgi:carboxymethylenebutenolidase